MGTQANTQAFGLNTSLRCIGFQAIEIDKKGRRWELLKLQWVLP